MSLVQQSNFHRTAQIKKINHFQHSFFKKWSNEYKFPPNNQTLYSKYLIFWINGFEILYDSYHLFVSSAIFNWLNPAWKVIDKSNQLQKKKPIGFHNINKIDINGFSFFENPIVYWATTPTLLFPDTLSDKPLSYPHYAKKSIELLCN